jgi:hypothetical protein
MHTFFTAAALERLRDQLLPFWEMWNTSTGRDLASVRDGLDFLTVMKNRDDIWETLATASSEPSCARELQALRAALPTAPLDEKAEAVEARLGRLGLSGEEVTTLLAAIAQPEGVGDAIREAFSADKPHDVARALEQILASSPEVIATDRHMRRYAGTKGASRVLGTLLGVALLLIGASYAPQAAASEASQPSNDQQAAAGQSADPKKSPSSNNGSARVKRPPKDGAHPHPKAKYKGISPRLRAGDTFAPTRTSRS